MALIRGSLACLVSRDQLSPTTHGDHEDAAVGKHESVKVLSALAVTAGVLMRSLAVAEALLSRHPACPLLEQMTRHDRRFLRQWRRPGNRRPGCGWTVVVPAIPGGLGPARVRRRCQSARRSEMPLGSLETPHLRRSLELCQQRSPRSTQLIAVTCSERAGNRGPTKAPFGRMACQLGYGD